MIPAHNKAPAAYDHGRHAGNHGDVLKHVLLDGLLEWWMLCHPNGVSVVDTHAAAGFYRLAATGEWQRGYGRVLEVAMSRAGRSPAPSLVERWLNQPPQSSFRRDGDPSHYAGSATQLSTRLRPVDRLWCTEQDAATAATLKTRMERQPLATVLHADGLDAALWQSTLPADRPAVVFIDPPYAAADEWNALPTFVRALEEALEQPLLVVVWYPLKGRSRPARLRRSLMEGSGLRWWTCEGVVDDTAAERGEMAGSGLMAGWRGAGRPDVAMLAGAAAWLVETMGVRDRWSLQVRG
jgi:23S rRNA (adenine2030-N6)-methyltransferase